MQLSNSPWYQLSVAYCLPDKAIDVIDDAGACVKVVREKAALLEEVAEARKRLMVHLSTPRSGNDQS
jgi:ATP-dependent Clp protease ATP-binding subunit ClpA